MTKNTLENEFGTYTIAPKLMASTIDNHYEYLIKPLLVASGFGEKTVEDYFEEDPCTDCKYNTRENLDKAINIIKNTQHHCGSKTPYLLLGDIAELLEIFVDDKIEIKDLIFESPK